MDNNRWKKRPELVRRELRIAVGWVPVASVCCIVDTSYKVEWNLATVAEVQHNSKKWERYQEYRGGTLSFSVSSAYRAKRADEADVLLLL